MFFLYDTGFLVFVLSFQEQQDLSQWCVKDKSRDNSYQPEIWRWKYLRKMDSKLQGSFCPKPYFDVSFMFIFLIICLASYLFPFDVGYTDLRTNLFKGGGDDATMVEPENYATKDKPGWLNGKLEDESKVGMEDAELISHSSYNEEHVKEAVTDMIRLMDEFELSSVQEKITNQEIERTNGLLGLV
ncbi:hypothetical protein N665_2936s0001 [Sinapis alba]|nr:hypothetical protein N665_2936s0001 [Sinapis alba]